jgi:hypothetical protein
MKLLIIATASAAILGGSSVYAQNPQSRVKEPEARAPGQRGPWFSGDVTIWRQGRCNRCAQSRSCAAWHSRRTNRASRLTDRKVGLILWRRRSRR